MQFPPENDQEFEEVRLREVEPDTRGFLLHREDGWTFWIERSDFVPKAGQTARFYGRGIGYPVRGVVVDGKVAFYRSQAEETARQAAASAEYEERRRAALAESKIPDKVTPGFEWTEDMAEISGFGGAYERACRQMISQGCLWWSEHPDADPRFEGFERVHGICFDDNEDAKKLSAAVCDGIDSSGAMHQAAITHVFHWRRLGSWVAYQASMRALARERG